MPIGTIGGFPLFVALVIPVIVFILGVMDLFRIIISVYVYSFEGIVGWRNKIWRVMFVL